MSQLLECFPIEVLCPWDGLVTNLREHKQTEGIP